ncbi:glycosyltransferase [Myroides guanonis]|uniref:Glycosyltransferase, GT2 family n=1 Tax=Myroides guanonis TaxID=1150112 RepID=A0A1I3LFD2_9FLAO|nr:glycosyltransferase [Myroides guanonis]SFI83514.1 Glycosyltransferase, GT2 family [Myroides guanonis]
MYYSFIIPVYNRPDEIQELLESMTRQTYKKDFEVVIVEDGSSNDCKDIIVNYSDQLSISYFFKENSGPGNSRNYGMKRAKGDYFIILDSDCILPIEYLEEVDTYLTQKYVDCFGGPDAALPSFTDIQKAINFTMTSILTTGGIRGTSERLSKFQPRSFNMGISRKAFEATEGFGSIHPGEDPDLSIRLWNKGFSSDLFPNAFVYHKRRIDWKKFYQQVNKFGKARPILNQRYPEYSKLTYWFPAFFCLGMIVSLLLIFVGVYLPIVFYLTYLVTLAIACYIKERSINISVLTIMATLIQFYGYGNGFLISTYKLFVIGKRAEESMPEMFFKLEK